MTPVDILSTAPPPLTQMHPAHTHARLVLVLLTAIALSYPLWAIVITALLPGAWIPGIPEERIALYVSAWHAPLLFLGTWLAIRPCASISPDARSASRTVRAPLLAFSLTALWTIAYYLDYITACTACGDEDADAAALVDVWVPYLFGGVATLILIVRAFRQLRAIAAAPTQPRAHTASR